MQCNHCGAEMKDGAIFCSECGNKLEPPKPRLKRCPTCGIEMPVGAKFCPNCGSSYEPVPVKHIETKQIPKHAAPVQKNYIQEKIAEKKEADRRRAEAELREKDEQQRKRYQRLTELENQQNQKRFGLLHPVQSKKNKKEIDELRDSIARYEKERANPPKKSSSLSVFPMIALCVVLMLSVILWQRKTETPKAVEEPTEKSFSLMEYSKERSSSSSAEDTPRRSAPSGSEFEVSSPTPMPTPTPAPTPKPTPTPTPEPETVSIKGNNQPMNIGETLPFSANVHPVESSSTDVTWSSDNSSIASVDANGIVTAISPGTAIITATSEAGVTDFVEVKVNFNPRTMYIYVSIYCNDYNSVGYNWTYQYQINGQVFNNGAQINVVPGDTIQYLIQVIEADTNPDYGSFYGEYVVTEDDYRYGFTITGNAIVRENQGRYSGHTANFDIAISFR